MCTSLRSLFAEILAEEGEHLAPRIHRLFGAIERPVPVIEAVAGAVIAIELVGLAEFLERSLMLVHLLGARRAVIVAEDTEQRTGEVLGHVDGRDRRFFVKLFLAHHDAATPHVDASVDILLLARIDEGVPPAR